MPDDFTSIRSWEGSKARAFEEICYQLLREPQDLPPGMVGRPVRTGNPDGGVEWYALTADDEQWGWQAKYVDDIDDLLNAMTGTVRRVVAERPHLTKLTFCIPGSLPAATAKGKWKSARRKYDDKVATWKADIPGADKIDFDLVQGSDLLVRLAMPKHAGRAWFWWNEPYLGPDWLVAFQGKQVAYAGDRYRPALQVDVPIQDDLSALGFAGSYFDELNKHIKLANLRLAEIETPPADLGIEVVESAQVVAAAAALLASRDSTTYQAGDDDPLESLDREVTACADALVAAQEQARAAEAALPEEKEQEGSAPRKEHLRHYSYRLSRAENAVYGLREFLNDSPSRAVRQGFYFLTGSAGTGKTHLCLDSAERALQEGRPALILFGGLFGAGDLWASLCDQLGLPPLGADVLLGALEAVAETSALNGRRFVVMIDALNDTTAAHYWATRLPALRAQFAARPFLSLLVSCRDTYLDYVDPDNRRQGFERIHPGFAGREFEATHKYFEHYGLQAPRIPLLLPEFTVPLFLLTYCEGLHGEGRTVPPGGHEGRVEIFERFLKVGLERVRTKLHLTPGTGKVRAALDALLDEMGATGRESVRWERAEELTAVQVPERTEWPETGLGALLSEGLLNDEMVYDGDAPARSVRITYQAFSDFLILQRRLRNVPGRTPPDAAFSEWLSTASWGIREAAAVLLPERYAVELPALLEPVVRGDNEPGGENSRRADRVMNSLDLMAVRSLPYRRPEAITERSIEFLNRQAQTSGSQKELLDVLFLCAPQPDSIVNGDGLHRHLSRFSMPRRDAAFGIPMYYELDDEGSPLSRLARWAAGGPYPDYEPRVVELTCIPLVWMLSSPNRFMRDWITKALVQVLSGHIDVAASLIERFVGVNDPYVLERLITVAYGSILRGGVDHPAESAQLGSLVEEQIFGRLDKLTPDALMIDSARGIIEWAVAQDQLTASSLEAARPPYGFTRPGNPPTKEHLDERYPHGEGTTEVTSYGSIFLSVLDFGDFGRYVIEPGMGYFLRVPLSLPRPVPQPAPEPRFLVTRWRKFKRALSAELAARAAPLFETEETPGPSAEEEIRQFVSSLSDDQHELLKACWQRPVRRSPTLDPSYPFKGAERWILQRTMTLGWTPQLFGRFDRQVNYHDADRDSHKPERFGKKYQWIAYHELLARVADTYHFDSGYGDEPEAFDGIYQLNDREIDPSLPPVPYKEFQERVAIQGTWRPTGVSFPGPLPGSVNFGTYAGDYRAFLNDRKSLPYPSRMVRLADDTGQSWLVLYAHRTQGIRAERSDTELPADRQFYSLYSWLVPRGEAGAVAAAMPAKLQGHSFSSDLVDSHGHVDCCYFGELGWRATRCPNRHDAPLTVVETDGTSLTVVSTIERYLWEGGIWDCSIEDSVRAMLPSRFLQQSSDLRWKGDTTSWHDGDELDMCYMDVTTADSQGDVLVVKEGWIREYLASREMALVYCVQGQREHRDDGTRNFSWLEFELSGTYDDGQLSPGESLTVLKNNRDDSRSQADDQEAPSSDGG